MRQQHYLIAAFFVGAAAILWVGSGFIDKHPLALLVTALIGGVYVIGFIEQWQFHKATESLHDSLLAIPQPLPALDSWLIKLPPVLQNPVRIRIEGERIALPVPVLAPYLVGLLVMLGLLGTFVGMVVTLKGAVLALEGTTELQAIRDGLTTPIEGLGMAFGTSVAGIAASAMLGLISTLNRRQRLRVTGLLDNKIADDLREFSLVHHRQETYRALQKQADLLPAVADKLATVTTQLQSLSDNIGSTLVANQDQFHHSIGQSYQQLADSVDQTLRGALTQSGQQVAESIQPIVTQVMQALDTKTERVYETLHKQSETHLQRLAENFKHTSADISSCWQDALAHQQQLVDRMAASMADALAEFTAQMQSDYDRWLAQQQQGDNERLEHWSHSAVQIQLAVKEQLNEVGQQLYREVKQIAGAQQSTAAALLEKVSGLLVKSEDLIAERSEAEAHWQGTLNDRLAQLVNHVEQQLSKLRQEEAARGDQAVDHLANLEASVARQIATLGNELAEPMAELINTASEAPQAAAEVIAQLREEISKTIERDNQLLAERGDTIKQLDGLLSAMAENSTAQRQGIEQLVATSNQVLLDVNEQLAVQVKSQTEQLSQVAGGVAASAIDMSGLGDAFAGAVRQFTDANEQLMQQLNNIETALTESTAKSDEQLAYYVAQAREIIDHSLLSQKEMIEDIRRLEQEKRGADADADDGCVANSGNESAKEQNGKQQKAATTEVAEEAAGEIE